MELICSKCRARASVSTRKPWCNCDGLWKPDFTPTPTLAEGIAIGRPMRGEEFPARKGIYCEHTTAANYAAYLRYCELYGPTPDCLITLCGAGLKSDH